jgi:hypothetical protein
MHKKGRAISDPALKLININLPSYFLCSPSPPSGFPWGREFCVAAEPHTSTSVHLTEVCAMGLKSTLLSCSQHDSSFSLQLGMSSP